MRPHWNVARETRVKKSAKKEANKTLDNPPDANIFPAGSMR